ncbi:MAG: DUF1800 domain-containing protein [Solimonas sp.]
MKRRLQRCGAALALLAGLGLGLAPVAMAMPEADARQLLLRSGFAPSPAEIAALAPLSGAEAVERIVDAAVPRRAATTPAPDWVDEALKTPAELKAMSDDERRAYRQMWVKRGAELQTWWMQEMIATPAPLAERMTLFWHGHFTSSLQAVKAGQLLYRQNVTLREHALGDYRALLHAVARDPAMLLFLNNQQNRKDAPNENFARELLELFTLGEGHYSERDVHEAARAFTGWKMRPPDGTFFESRSQHDDGVKTFLGHRGDFDGDDIIDIILQQPQAATFIVEALWREFVSPQPDRAEVARLAARFRHDWQIAPLMKALFAEPAVTDATQAGVLVKSPVEFVVGAVRSLALPLSPRSVALASDEMGQGLFNPPNVRGWPGGDDWISSAALLARRQFVLSLSGDASPATGGDGREAQLRKAMAREMKPRQADVTRRFGEAAESLPPRGAENLLLALAPVQAPVEGAKPTDRLETWMLDPVYNLK